MPTGIIPAIDRVGVKATAAPKSRRFDIRSTGSVVSQTLRRRRSTAAMPNTPVPINASDAGSGVLVGGVVVS